MNDKLIRLAFKQLLAYTSGIYKSGQNLLSKPFNIKDILDNLITSYKYNKNDIIIITGAIGVGKSFYSEILSNYDPFYKVIELNTTINSIPKILKRNLTIINIRKEGGNDEN